MPWCLRAQLFLFARPNCCGNNGIRLRSRGYHASYSLAAATPRSSVEEVCEWAAAKEPDGIGLNAKSIDILQREDISGAEFFDITDAELEK